MVKSLQGIAKDETLVMELVNHLVDIMNNSVLYEEQVDPKQPQKKGPVVATHTAMSATCALGEIIEDDLDEVIKTNYAMLISTLMMRVGTAQGMSDNKASE